LVKNKLEKTLIRQNWDETQGKVQNDARGGNDQTEGEEGEKGGWWWEKGWEEGKLKLRSGQKTGLNHSGYVTLTKSAAEINEAQKWGGGGVKRGCPTRTLTTDIQLRLRLKRGVLKNKDAETGRNYKLIS